MKTTHVILGCAVVGVMAGAVLGDWDPGDPHKMHHPQLPDPGGWDVRISNARRQPGEPPQWVVADDWECSQTGPVDDVHFWVSWMQDVVDTLGIRSIHLSIHDNIPVGPDGWSIPGGLIREWDIGPTGFTVRHYGSEEQGWFDPPFEEWQPNDHTEYYQINIVDIPDPFTQQAGTIYWLDISVDLGGESETGKLGWKTSQDHWMDDAVYWDPIDQRWIELRDPMTTESLDMAFVITPEPGTLLLLAGGLAGACGARRRRAHS